MLPIDERYLRDPVFQQLVDMLEHLLEKHQTTPTELREALMLAQRKYEARHLRPLLLRHPEAQARADEIQRREP